MSSKELKQFSRRFAQFVLVLALWACGYGLWILGPALGSKSPLNPPFLSSTSQAQIGLIFFVAGVWLFLGGIERNLPKTIIGSAAAAVLFAFLFGSFVLTMPHSTAVPSYFVATVLSTVICRSALLELFAPQKSVLNG